MSIEFWCTAFRVEFHEYLYYRNYALYADNVQIPSFLSIVQNFIYDYIHKILQNMQNQYRSFPYSAFNVDLIPVSLFQIFCNCILDVELQDQVCSISQVICSSSTCVHLLYGYYQLDAFHHSSFYVEYYPLVSTYYELWTEHL